LCPFKNNHPKVETGFMEVLAAGTDADILACFAVMKVLRPHLDEASFVSRVRRQEAQGYRLVAGRNEDRIVAAAGYRLAEFLAWGKVLYIDDLITDPAQRGHGFGGVMMDWLIARAREEGCAQVHLDTGYQRHSAHRLYLKKGLELNCHHLALKLGQG
jgi:GNAT superfamily N-acetyltransferase